MAVSSVEPADAHTAQVMQVTPAAPGSAAELTARVRAVMQIAARHASAVDAAARFPSEAFEATRRQRLLGIQVPRALGGEGRRIGEIADVCYLLAQACSSTGMIYAMHQIMSACLLRHRGTSRGLERLGRRLADEQLLLASSTTEGTGGGNIRSSEAPIELHDGRVTLERRASVISYGEQADGILSTARRAAEAEASDQVMVALTREDYRLERLQGWNTLGMRGTCSEGYTLKASASADQLLPVPYAQVHSQTLVPTAHLLWASVWSGIAASAVARAQAFIRHSMRHGSGQLPPGAAQFGQAQASLRTLRGMLSSALRAYERGMEDAQALASLEFQSMITITKVEASELAVSIVLRALRVCGLTGYRCDHEFSVERQLRDVLSSPIMINNERILANLAGTMMLSPIPGSVHE